MLSFTKLGNSGRLGNQLFQYAFLRTQAEKLGIPFYCPNWVGDDIFTLQDKDLRVITSTKIVNTYYEPVGKDYNRANISLSDNTEIVGHFESEKNFNIQKVRKWYSFREEKIIRVKEKYSSINFIQSIGLHLRLCDKEINKYFKKIYYVPRLQYYIDALDHLDSYENLLIFSDNISAARDFFKNLNSSRIIYMQDNADWEDLYLMTQCRDFVCGASTLGWWGAWLGERAKKNIIFPREGIHRPGTGFKNNDLIPPRWTTIKALHPIKDNYIIDAFPLYNIHHRCIIFIGKTLRRFFPKTFDFLLPYFW